MVKSSMAVHDLRRSLFKPIVCCVGHMPLLAAAVKSGSDGHDENKRDALNCFFNRVDVLSGMCECGFLFVQTGENIIGLSVCVCVLLVVEKNAESVKSGANYSIKKSIIKW